MGISISRFSFCHILQRRSWMVPCHVTPACKRGDRGPMFSFLGNWWCGGGAAIRRLGGPTGQLGGVRVSAWAWKRSSLQHPAPSIQHPASEFPPPPLVYWCIYIWPSGNKYIKLTSITPQLSTPSFEVSSKKSISPQLLPSCQPRTSQSSI